MFKRFISAVLIFAVLISAFPASVVFAEDAEITEISNQYIKVVVNSKNGGYVISTLEGDILKKSDNNVSITHRGENYDTSFTSFKIEGDEYVFGEDGSEVITETDVNGNFVKSIWSVGDFEIEQIVSTFQNKEAVDDFSVAVTYDEIKAKKYSLAAGQYFDVKIDYVELTQDEFNAKMAEYTENLQKFFAEGNALQVEIMEQLKKVKYEKM